ncbi:MAG: hypothetical protein Kow0027_00750 [Saprospiraceae bacterium]
MKRKFALAFVLLGVVLWSGYRLSLAERVEEIKTKPVAEVLEGLGDAPLPHKPDLSVPGASVENGRDLVLYGSALGPDGRLGKRISRHFVCTACHNVERDEPDLSQTNPVARLEYVASKGLPYLQGSALYGIVNRTGFYNGDYYKKYGDLVTKARHDLREAIQLCATECSQGRLLEDWEMESVLAYLWTIGLKMEDLKLSEQEYQLIAEAKNGDEQGKAIATIKEKYLSGMPATFVDPPEDRKRNQPVTGDASRGKLIYELSCLHCHQDRRYSFFLLDSSQLSLQFLDKHFSKYDRYSVYQVVRYGTSPVPWKRAYMPQYTLEKMDEQMLEDLRTYLRQAAM